MKKDFNHSVDGIPFSSTMRAYTKSEVACMYMPDISRESAVKSLNRWIKLHPTLLKDLEEDGASLLTRRYTPKQVRMIFRALGSP